MKISDVMRETGLTRKAIYYYEEMGLINPTKEEDNSYRNYSEAEVERLKQVKALRLLDVSLQKIKNIFDTPMSFNNVMVEQLEKIKEKINVLNETEKVIKSLLENDNSTSNTKNLDRLNYYLDLNAKSTKDYMKKELERIFPSGFGKLVAVMYGAFLDEPIDTKEKEQVWKKFVNTLDETESIQFPDEINEILNHLYEQISREGIEQFEIRSKNIVNNVNTFNDNLTEDEKEEIKRRIQEAQNQEGYTEMYEMSKKLFMYIKENPNILPEDFSEYLKVLSSKYNDFSENFLKTFKSKYAIGKTFGPN
ncbi:MerR family transcriptional regulator [Neobacillus sp. PS3-40]|uniref:MerR family transcriptional regulator n=1 Tax=Neobacillus sp. PS3-40 TaxID=3070679 RepID=UPI0027DF1837|nr:MerR family transcriptional regulator [Neobacillus sp. PS3-40]WML44582.1 MerR family transcriptional regulator [Neobacillus sp. PS3-40]